MKPSNGEIADSTWSPMYQPSSLCTWVCYKQDNLFCYLRPLRFSLKSMEGISVRRTFLHREDQELSIGIKYCLHHSCKEPSTALRRPGCDQTTCQGSGPRSGQVPDLKGRNQLGSGSSCLIEGGQCLLWPFQTLMHRVCEHRKTSGFHATKFKEFFYTAVATMRERLHTPQNSARIALKQTVPKGEPSGGASACSHPGDSGFREFSK